MKLRTLFAALAVALIATVAFAPSAFAKPSRGTLLKDAAVTGALADGGSFAGTVTITSFAYNATNGLIASGVLKGVATDVNGVATEVTQSFANVDANLTKGTAAAAGSLAAMQTGAGACQILFLDLGPIFLDLLGLQVDLSQIVLDITAQSGAGNLLGNLLCAVVNLLNPDGFLSGLLGGLTQLTNLLTQINQLLSRL